MNQDPNPLHYTLHHIRVLQPRIRVVPTKLSPDDLLIPLRDVSLDQVGNLKDSPSTF